MFETAMITAMHGLMSYRFPTAVREILKGLLRSGMLALIIQSNIHPLKQN